MKKDEKKLDNRFRLTHCKMFYRRDFIRQKGMLSSISSLSHSRLNYLLHYIINL